ncbi:hypothetical protein [Amaricoccus solimangrovi]|uniref:Uncharacterized protein n=1 Tax=Amaricoccus solimangrovi TaxID=2589815 RepID=A0A501WZB4_9RHOB|nr:hypothetical protein [Amaricoccus solimangrovi]TPE53067.1 hypothetical protein FJM51_03310 [Amaricoccus solimangrovi]
MTKHLHIDTNGYADSIWWTDEAGVSHRPLHETRENGMVSRMRIASHRLPFRLEDLDCKRTPEGSFYAITPEHEQALDEIVAAKLAAGNS